MRRGAFALFDALGFKGIWARPECKDDPSVVFAKMRELKEVAERARSEAEDQLADLSAETGFKIAAKVAFLSDTVAVGAWPVDSQPEVARHVADAVPLFAAAHIAWTLAARALETPPTLLYRGCIAVGDFDLERKRRAAALSQAPTPASAQDDPGSTELTPGHT
jgi:hypothetical protein